MSDSRNRIFAGYMSMGKMEHMINYDCHQGIKDAPPIKDEDWDQQSSPLRLIGQATRQRYSTSG